MRKWTYLVAALLMAGATTTFTGCIDNDEPEGITNLRGAKADLLRAKCAVEAAEAALKNAYATEHLAQAKWTEAMAENQKLLNESQKIKNEVEAAKSEQEKAYWAAQLAEVEADLAKNKLTWEKDRLVAATILAQAQKDYEDAMKAIELSKNYLSEAELGQLNFVQGEYSYAYAKLYSGSYTRYTATVDKTTGKVSWTSKTQTVALDASAKGILKAAYDGYEADVDTDGEYESISEIKLNARVADAKAKLEVGMAELGIKQEALKALESSETLANWKKVKAQYKAKQDSLNDVVANKTIAANKIVIENADKAMAMQKALNTAAEFTSKTFADGKIVQDPKDNAEVKASEALTGKLAALSGDLSTAGGAYVSYAGNKFTVALNKADLLKVTRDNGDNGTATLVEANLTKETEGKAPYEYWNENGVKLLDDAIIFNDGETTEYAKMNNAIDAVIKVLNGAKDNVPSIEKEQAEKELVAAKTDLEAKKKAKTDATTAWTKSIADWKTAEGYTTEEADLKAVKDASTAYTKAMNDANGITDASAKAKAILKAQQTFADAIVKYYNAAAPLQLTSNKISIKLTVGSKETWVTKTAKEWLTDSENKDVYLAELITYFGNDATRLWTVGTKETVEAGKEPSVKATGALATLKTKDEILNVWTVASKALYGTEKNLGYYVVDGKDYGRETTPSDAEIKAQWEKTPTTVGACGAVLTAEKRVKTAEEAVAQVDQFASVVKGLEDVKGTIAKAKLDFMTEAETKIKVAKDAQKACVDGIDAPVLVLGIASDKALNEKIGHVIDAVEGSVGAFDTELAEDALKETAKYIALIQSMKTDISTLQKKTIPAAEEELIKAEAMLKAYKDGNMTAQHVIAWAQAKVDSAKANYENAVQELTYWTQQVKDVTATLYNKAK